MDLTDYNRLINELEAEVLSLNARLFEIRAAIRVLAMKRQSQHGDELREAMDSDA